MGCRIFGGRSALSHRAHNPPLHPRRYAVPMTLPAAISTSPNQRAAAARDSVTALFARPLFFLPGTLLAATELPARRLHRLTQPWHYWWQAHFVDTLVDAAQRERRLPSANAGSVGSSPAGVSSSVLAARLLSGIRIRNVLVYVNGYFDDMAWLALAAQRLEQGAVPAARRGARIQQSLEPQLRSACTSDLGGGTYWSRKRDFKNTPATGPVALYLARLGDHAAAQQLVDWLDVRLFDHRVGLYLDGTRITADGSLSREGPFYTYNQGPVLGALLELGGAANLARAAHLIHATAEHLTVPDTPPSQGAKSGSKAQILRCEGVGDRGLFTGILTRYLALAARDVRLPRDARQQAADLVRNTAEGFWAGRVSAAAVVPGVTSIAAESLTVFPAQALFPAPEDAGIGTGPEFNSVELSTQLQAWMALEAAATLRS